MSEEYQFTTEAIDQYYSGTDEWQAISNNNIKPEDVETVLGQVPNVDVVKSDSGKVLSYNFKASENVASDAAEAVNSNTPPNVKSFDIPANTAVDSGGNMTFVSGMSQAGNFVFTKVVPAVAAAGVGIELGKLFDKVLYNANPDFWDEKGMSTLDPDKWGDIIGTDTAGGRFLNMILGTTPDGKTQAYIDQNALAYTALYMQNKGALSSEIGLKNNNLDAFTVSTDFRMQFISDFNAEEIIPNKYYSYADMNGKISVTPSNSPVYFFSYIKKGATSKDISSLAFSKNAFRLHREYGGSPPYEYNATEITYNGDTFYIDRGVGTFVGNISDIPNNPTSIYTYEYGQHVLNIIHPIQKTISASYDSFTYNNVSYSNDYVIAWALLYGGGSSLHSVEGIGTQDGAKTPDLSGATTVDEALNALQQQYPEVFADAVTQNVVQPDGSTVTYTYVPIAMPELDPEGNPVSSTSTQANPQIDPATATAPLLDIITKLLQKDNPVNPPDTGSGDSPIVVPATGSASALYAIYNPTLSQINAFGAWLWSDNFIEQIKKLFNDPMQAIIGLHKVYANPATSGAQNIKVGYLDSGVSANVVSNQYTTIDCGTVTLSEYFHNVFDYAPYTQINLYLPFIGIVNLDNADVMRSSIHIIYHVDVLSGACLAEVKVTRDGAGGTLYQYTGNASVTMPISSGSYMGIVTSIASIAGGIAGTIASGGAALPMLASAAGSALNARAKVEHSGGFSGNAGAMGGKIPYLIISRPQVALANNFQKYIGYPANYTTRLSTCAGFVKVLECHIENVNATNTELTEIESLLKEGVII